MSGWKWLIVGCLLGSSAIALLPALGSLREAFAQGADASNPLASSHGSIPNFTQLVESVGPAVVNVTTRTARRHVADAAERHFELYRGITRNADNADRGLVGIGSGFVLRSDGYILTNAHVVVGAEEVYVHLPGRRNQVRARVIGTDADTDIALLKIQVDRLPVVRTGSSRALKVGDWVAAIGSPFGFDNTMTAGIVSAKERRLPQGPQTAFLQSDVAINPGSSGGPLVNLQGEVVGINSKIYTRTGGYMGVSFAIPIETALEVGDALRRSGDARRASEDEAERAEIASAVREEFGAARGARVTAKSLPDDGPTSH